jgi:hypothetical protein
LRPSRSWRVALLAFVASRAVVWAGTFLGLLLTGLRRGTGSSLNFLEALGAWDGAWYISVAVNGYARELIRIGEFDGWTNIAFFPLFPMLVRGLGLLLGLPALPAALFVAHLFGALSAWCVWRLALELTDEVVAQRVVWLYCFFPGAVFLSMAYPEGLFIALAALCLLAIHRQQWLAAGIVAALASATRSHGIVLIATCAVVALHALARHRTWRPLLTAVLAPTGLLAFFAFLWSHTGDPLIWFRAMDAWTPHVRPGAGLIQPVVALLNPMAHGPFTGLLGIASIAGVIYAAVWQFRIRLLPLAAWLYAAGIVALVVLVSDMGPRPRYILLAFPLLLPVASSLSHERFLWATRRLAIILVFSALLYTNGFGAVP